MHCACGYSFCEFVFIDARSVDSCLQDVNRGGSRHKLLHNVGDEEGDFMVHGESGESSVTTIPFQVL